MDSSTRTTAAFIALMGMVCAAMTVVICMAPWPLCAILGVVGIAATAFLAYLLYEMWHPDA